MNEEIDFTDGMEYLKSEGFEKPIPKVDKPKKNKKSIVKPNPFTLYSWGLANPLIKENIIYIFQESGRLLISTNGNVKKFAYEIIENTDNIIISNSENDIEVLYTLLTINDNIFVIKNEKENELLVLFNNSKTKNFTQDLSNTYASEIIKKCNDSPMSFNEDLKKITFKKINKHVISTASLLFKNKEYKKAIEYNKKALILLPNDIEAIKVITECYANLKDGEGCIKYLFLLNKNETRDFSLKILLILHNKGELEFSHRIIQKVFLNKTDISYLERNLKISSVNFLKAFDVILFVLAKNSNLKGVLLILTCLKENSAISHYQNLVRQASPIKKYLTNDYNIEKYYLVHNIAEKLIKFNKNYLSNGVSNLSKSLDFLINLKNKPVKPFKDDIDNVSLEINKVQNNLFIELEKLIEIKDVEKPQKIIAVLINTRFKSIAFNKAQDELKTFISEIEQEKLAQKKRTQEKLAQERLIQEKLEQEKLEQKRQLEEDKRDRKYKNTKYTLIFISLVISLSITYFYLTINLIIPTLSEKIFWERAIEKNDFKLFKQHLKYYPNGYYSSKITNDIKNKIVIYNYVLASDNRNFNKMMTYFSGYTKRYWNLKYPTRDDIKQVIKNIWRKTINSQNEVHSIEKIDLYNYILNTTYSYKSIKTNKIFNIKSKVHYTLNSLHKIKEIYGVKNTNNTIIKKKDNIPPWFKGDWIGSAYSTQTNEYFSLKINFSNDYNIVEISYPSLKCSGEWSVLNKIENKIEMREKILFGLNNCTDHGKIKILKSNNKLLFYYYWPTDNTLASKGELFLKSEISTDNLHYLYREKNSSSTNFNLWSKPNAYSTAIYSIHKNSMVYVISEYNTTFSNVFVDGYYGYIITAYLD